MNVPKVIVQKWTNRESNPCISVTLTVTTPCKLQFCAVANYNAIIEEPTICPPMVHTYLQCCTVQLTSLAVLGTGTGNWTANTGTGTGAWTYLCWYLQQSTCCQFHNAVSLFSIYFFLACELVFQICVWCCSVRMWKINDKLFCLLII